MNSCSSNGFVKCWHRISRMFRLVELTGDLAPDMRAVASADVIITTPEKWDGVSRSWHTRGYVRQVALLIIDEIHLLGEKYVCRTSRQASSFLWKVHLVSHDITPWICQVKISFLCPFRFEFDSLRGLSLHLYFSRNLSQKCLTAFYTFLFRCRERSWHVDLHLVRGHDMLTFITGQDRGPVLEVIVSRTNFISSQTEKPVRIVGLSTALANARDLADWLGINQVSVVFLRYVFAPIFYNSTCFFRWVCLISGHPFARFPWRSILRVLPGGTTVRGWPQWTNHAFRVSIFSFSLFVMESRHTRADCYDVTYLSRVANFSYFC